MEYAESGTKLRGRALWLARVAWGALALFSIGYYISWFVVAMQLPIGECTPAAVECNPIYLTAQDLAAFQATPLPLEWLARTFYALNALSSLLYILVALFIVRRKSDDGMALWLSAVIMALGAVGFTPETIALITPGSPLRVPETAVAFFGYFAPFATLYFFPDGRFNPLWSRWVCFVFVVVATYFGVVELLGSSADNSLLLIALPILAASILVGIGTMVYRFRRAASPLQRQQIKWVASGLTVVALGVVFWITMETFFPARQPNPTRTIVVALTFPFFLLAETLLPISVAIAVIRYRLWDIDVIIRRTLIYAALTAVLVLLYFGIVVLLQQALRAMTGQSSEIAIIVSTLAIAALFAPLRHRVQNTIDRRFYRRKYDAQKVLAAFGATARDEVDLNKLTSELVGVVQETMQPTSVGVWLKPMNETRTQQSGSTN
ncbi:MAG: hypothetical protein HY782_19765 [Chloroflexi bacterium]|nr:hypothetical protein [Chloroflexota bacterium]